MTQYNKHIYIYEPIKLPIPGGLSSRIVLVKGKKGNYFIDTATQGKWINKKNFKRMKKDKIELKRTLGFLHTHFHPDHARGLEFWGRFVCGGTPAFIHPEALDFFKNPGSYGDLVIDLLGDMYKNVVPFPPKLSTKVTNWLWGEDPDYSFVDVISDGQEFDLGGVKIIAHYTPGHSPDHIAYEIEIEDNDNKYLVSGDLLSLKDMKDGKGEVGLASFNNPLASLNAELETLRKVLDISPDVLITQHYGTIEGQNEIERHIKQALDEGHYLKSKTLEVLSEAGGKGVEFKRLTKKVIDFPKYLSGIATRTNSMWVILKEYIDEGLVERIQGSSRFRVA